MSLSSISFAVREEEADLPINAPIRDSGTATSVDHICVPSGLMARLAHRACFLADQSESICSAVLADSKDLHWYDCATCRADVTLSLIEFSVPENLANEFNC